MPEGFLRLEPVIAAHAAVNQYRGLGTSEQGRDAFVQVAQRIPMLGEQDQLLPWRRGRLGDLAGAIGGVRLRDVPGEPVGGEDFAEQARELPPLGIRTASAYLECQAFQSPEGLDLRLELHDGSRRGRPIEDCLLGDQDLVLGRLVEILDILGVELGPRGGDFNRGPAAAPQHLQLPQPVFQPFAASAQRPVDGLGR